MSDKDNVHANSLADQLCIAEENDNLPEEIAEKYDLDEQDREEADELVTDSSNRSDGVVAHVEDDLGLWIPLEVREFDRQVVIRTPQGTIQHFSSELPGPYYGMVDVDV